MSEKPSLYALRFRKGHARVLRAIAGRTTNSKLAPGIRIAASAAKAGEPMGLDAKTVDQANAVADGFKRLGVPRPKVLEAGPGGWEEVT